MKTTKLINKIGIGTKIKVLHKIGIISTQTIVSLSGTGRWYTDLGFYIDKDFTIQGTVATWVPLTTQFKRYKFRYKR